ncbi:MAG: ATP-binding cassette domain-containing protein [Alphaproteobacteria bacterium]
MAILEVGRLSERFGGLAAVDGLSFRVAVGEIRGLIGPNGAGKAITFNASIGYTHPTKGLVGYEGRDISALKASAIAARSLVRTFQATTLFRELPAPDNVLAGRHLHARSGWLDALLVRDRGVDSTQA